MKRIERILPYTIVIIMLSIVFALVLANRPQKTLLDVKEEPHSPQCDNRNVAPWLKY